MLDPKLYVLGDFYIIILYEYKSLNTKVTAPATLRRKYKQIVYVYLLQRSIKFGQLCTNKETNKQMKHTNAGWLGNCCSLLPVKRSIRIPLGLAGSLFLGKHSLKSKQPALSSQQAQTN